MNKKNIVGIFISLVGLFIMGFEMGRNAKTDENNLVVTFIGLFVVFVGAFIVISSKTKKSK